MFHSVLPSPFSTGIFRRTLFLDSLSKTSQQPMQQHKKHITRRLIEIHKQRQQHDNQQQFTKREYTLHPLTSPQVMRQRERRKNRESKSDGSNNASSRVRSFERTVHQSREREIARRSKQERMARDNESDLEQESERITHRDQRGQEQLRYRIIMAPSCKRKRGTPILVYEVAF
jgi:hypothetical protein